MRNLNIKSIILWILNIYLLITIVVLGFYMIENQATFLAGKRAEEKISEMQASYGGDTIERTGQIGKTFVTAYYPKDGNKADQTVVKKVEADAAQYLLDKKTDRPSSYVFYVNATEDSPLANTKWVVLEKKTFEMTKSGFAKEKVSYLDHYYINDQGGKLPLTALFTDATEAKTIFINQIWQNLIFNQIDETLVEEQMTEMAKSSMADWEFNYIDGRFIIHLPNEIEGVSTSEVPLTAFYDVINPEYLKGKDLEAYKKKDQVNTSKVVALTFDDGPDPELTPKTLEILKKHKIKATFFMMGSHAAENPDVVKKVVKEGHEVGNHSWSHPNLQAVDAATALQEVNDTTTTLEKITGKPIKLFRPPYGNYTPALLDAENLSFIMWSVDTLDWKSHDPDAILKEVKNQIKPGGIILMHDIHKESVESLDAVIEYLKEQGYEFATVSDLLKDSGPKGHTVYFSRE